jgi:RNA polymerase sigma-70 factor (ECF subfamily)
MEDLREGGEPSFKALFDSYYSNLCYYAFTLLRDMDEAEDMVQTVFMKLWERKETLMFTGTAKAYLYKAVYHQCINQLEARQVRQKYKERAIVTPQEVQQPEAFPQELEESVKAVIDALPQQCKRIFMMSRYEELRYSEIASQLGISVNTIENQISKALKILRAHFNDRDSKPQNPNRP